MPKPFELRKLSVVEHEMKDIRFADIQSRFIYVPPGTFWAGGWPLPSLAASYSVIQRGFWLQCAAVDPATFKSGNFNSFLKNNSNFRLCTDLELEYISRYRDGHKYVNPASNGNNHMLYLAGSRFNDLALPHIVTYHKNTDLLLRYGIDVRRDNPIRGFDKKLRFWHPIGLKYDRDLMDSEAAATAIQTDRALWVRLVWNGEE